MERRLRDPRATTYRKASLVSVLFAPSLISNRPRALPFETVARQERTKPEAMFETVRQIEPEGNGMEGEQSFDTVPSAPEGSAMIWMDETVRGVLPELKM